MANQEHLDILAKGVGAWNAWRGERPIQPDISDANLNNMDLARANFLGVNASRASFRGADLDGVDCSGSDLSDAIFDDAMLQYVIVDGASLRGASFKASDLSHAVFYQANLSDANFGEANFRFASLIRSDLHGANFAGACAFETVFSDIDLSEAKGLDTVQHDGPSTIGIDTIYKSKGQIPESFLRGAGVPENFIVYMRSLTGAAFDFYSCFISYSTKDQEFADRLHADLQAKGVRCWFAPHDIQAGKKIHEQIDEAIRIYDKLLLILSDASMNSEWVSTEISKARKRERQEKHRMLFPVSLVPFSAVEAWECFDADAKKDSAREIREFFIPDFSSWKDHDAYAKAFERLLRDLKAGTSRATSEPR